MKKTFIMTNPRIKSARLFESAKNEVSKYLKREEKKTLAEGADYWDFDCKYGATAEDARTIHRTEINKCIDEAESQQLESFYLEILAKPGFRKKTPDALTDKPIKK